MADPRISLDDDGTLDDFAAVGVNLVHFEALDQSQWYLTVELHDGAIWQLKFGACNDRAKGYAFAEQVKEPESIFRSGGQTYDYGTRPHISVPRPPLS